MKNVALLPVNTLRSLEYTTSQSKLFDRDTWDYAYKSGKTDYYAYLLNQASEKELDASILEGIEDPEDQLTKLYQQTLADSEDSKQWDLQIGVDEQGNAQYFQGTEVEYIDKLLDMRKEYREYETQLAEEKARKDAMSGWEKTWNDIGAWFGEVGTSLTRLGGEVLNFLSNVSYYGSGIGVIVGTTTNDWTYKDWDLGLRETADKWQQDLGEWERQYTSFRDLDTGELTSGGKFAVGMAQGVATQIPALIANFVLPGSGMLIMYGTSAASQLDQYFTEGNVDPIKAIVKTAISVGFEIAIEKGLGKIFGMTAADVAKYGKGVTKAGKVAAIESVNLSTKQGLKSIGSSVLHFAKDVAQEGLEEYLQEWSNIATSAMFSLIDQGFSSELKDENGNWLTAGDLFEQTAFAGLIGAALSPVIGTVGKLRNVGNVVDFWRADYQITKDGKTRKLNFFEKIAAQTELNTFQEQIQMANEGSLSSEDRVNLYKSAKVLGDLFNAMGSQKLQRALRYMTMINDYAKSKAANLEELSAREEQLLIDRVDKATIKYSELLLDSVYNSKALARLSGKTVDALSKLNKAEEADVETKSEVIEEQKTELAKVFETSQETPAKTLTEKTKRTTQEENKTKLQQNITRLTPKLTEEYKNKTRNELRTILEDLDSDRAPTYPFAHKAKIEIVKNMLTTFTEANRYTGDAFGLAEDTTYGQALKIVQENQPSEATIKKLKKSLDNKRTEKDLAKQNVAKINALLDKKNVKSKKNAYVAELIKDQKVENLLNDIVLNGRLVAIVPGADHITTDDNTVFIPEKMITSKNLVFIEEGIAKADIQNTFLDTILNGRSAKENTHANHLFKLYQEAYFAFAKAYPNYQPRMIAVSGNTLTNEPLEEFFTRELLFGNLAQDSFIKKAPEKFNEFLREITNLVIGVRNHYSGLADSYTKVGNQIFKVFRNAAFNFLNENAGVLSANSNLKVKVGDFVNILTKEQIELLSKKAYDYKQYAKEDSFVENTKIVNPMNLTKEDCKIQLREMAAFGNQYATEALQFVEGKIPFEALSPSNPYRVIQDPENNFWSDSWVYGGLSNREDSDALDALISTNSNGNKTYPRSCVQEIDMGAINYEIRELANNVGNSGIIVISGYVKATNLREGVKPGLQKSKRILIQNNKKSSRNYIPLLTERGFGNEFIYGRNASYKVVYNSHDVLVLEPLDVRESNRMDFQGPATTSSEFEQSQMDGMVDFPAYLTSVLTPEFNSKTPEQRAEIAKTKTFKFPILDKTLAIGAGRGFSVNEILSTKTDNIIKGMADFTNIVKYGNEFLSDSFKASMEREGFPLNEQGFFIAVKRWLLRKSGYTISMSITSDGESYYPTNVSGAMEKLTPTFKKYLKNPSESTLYTFLKKTLESGKEVKLSDIIDTKFLGVLADSLGKIAIEITTDPTESGEFSSIYKGSTTWFEADTEGQDGELGSWETPNTIRTIGVNISEEKINGELLNTICHEIQHAIQEAFGLMEGGSPTDFVLTPAAKAYIDKHKPWRDRMLSIQKGAMKTYRWSEQVAKDYAYNMITYMNLQEMEARSEDLLYNYFPVMATSGRFGRTFFTFANGKTYLADKPLPGYFDVKKVSLTEAETRQIEFLREVFPGLSDEELLKIEVPKAGSAYVDPQWWESLSADERKASRSITNIKRSNYIFQKYYKTKKRLDKRVQGLLEDIGNEERLNQLPADLRGMIKDGSEPTYDNFVEWFKKAEDIDEDTFKLFVDNIFPGTNIKSFEELEDLTMKLGYSIDKEGNIRLDSKGNPIENVYKNRGQEFSPEFQKYRAALMEHYDPAEGLRGMQKYVRTAEYLGRTVSGTDITAEDDKREFGDTTEEVKSKTLEEEVFGEREKLETNVAKYLALQARQQYKDDKITKEQLDKRLEKLRANKDGEVELLAKYSDKELRKLSNQLAREQTSRLGGEEAAAKRVAEAERNVEEKTEKQLAQEKQTRVRLRKIASLLSFMTEEELRDFIGNDAQYFRRGEDGLYHYQVSGKGSLTGDVQAAREKLLAKLEPKVLEVRAKQQGRLERYKVEQRVKAEQLKKAEQTKKVEVETIKPNKVAPVNRIGLKIGNKVVMFDSTTNQIPKILQKVFENSFTLKGIEDNSKFSFGEFQNFLSTNEYLTVLPTVSWLSILEFFEQSNPDEANAKLFNKTKLYTLSTMVALMKIGQFTINQDYINRANNLMSKDSVSASEKAAWNNLIGKFLGADIDNSSAYIPEAYQERLSKALATDNEKEMKTVVELIHKRIEEDRLEYEKDPKRRKERIWNKILSFRYTAMLSSPMTWFRNIFSNVVVKQLNKASSWLGEKFFGKIVKMDTSPKRLVKRIETLPDGSKVTKYEETGKVPDYKLTGTKVDSEIAAWIKTELVDSGLLHQLTEGYSKYDPNRRMNAVSGVDYIANTIVENAIKQYNLDHTFRTPALNWFHKFVTKMISDEKFINEATLRYFGKMLTEDISKGRISKKTLKAGIYDAELSDVFARAQWLAFTDYMRNGNFVTKWLSELNKADNPFAKYAIPLVAPFAQSSVNWWVETMRYSPFGLAKSIITLIKYDKYVAKQDKKRLERGEIAQPEGLDRYLAMRNVGKGLIGTALYILGGVLGAMGIAGLSKKDDKYVLYIGDKIELDISNYFNSSTVIAGIATWQGISDLATGQSKNPFDILSKIFNAYGETLFLTDLLGEYRYSSGIGDYVSQLPYNFVYSMVPNFMKLTARLINVNTTKYSSGILGDIQKLLAGIPGMSYLMDNLGWTSAYIDPYTGKKNNGFWGIIENVGTQFGATNTGKNYFGISEPEKEAMKLGIKLGNLSGSITVDGKEYNLNATTVNTYAGQYVNDNLTKLMEGQLKYNGKSYSKLTDEEKTKAFNYYINKSREYAKIQAWTEAGHKYYASEEMYRTLRNLGITNVYLGNKGYVV